MGEKETKSQAEYKAMGLGVKKEKNGWIQKYKSIRASPPPGQGISHKCSRPKTFHHITA